MQGLPPESDYRFKHALIQDAAYENLLKSRRQVLHRRVAEILRDRFAATAAAEPEVLAHHFTQAGLTDAAIEWWGKAGDQALRRSAFQEAISHLGKAIAMADKAEEGVTRGATALATASAGRRLKLQTSYGQALMWSKGFGAEEARAAFARARELAANIENPDERFLTYNGQWAGSLLRGELGLAREIGELMLRDAGKDAQTPEALAARRMLGATCFSQGDFVEARAHVEEALRIDDSDWDRDAKFRFGHDLSVAATAYLAHTKWQLGEIGRARQLIEEAVVRTIESAHVPTQTNTYVFKALFEAVRGAADYAARDAEILVQIGQEHGLALAQALGALYSAWAHSRLGNLEIGAANVQQALATYTDQGNKLWVPFFQGLLAVIEAQGDAVEALTRIEDALLLARQTGERWSDALLHRVRGEILLKRDPASTALAEEAFFTAIAIAQQQKARSFELRAALSLATLYQSSNRPADAHTVLAPALEGFSPTPEFPEIAEAQTLLAVLA